MFLTRLQSGFLLFEIQQGFVRVELSLWQRAYLLWTFRNFRHLSISLLNPRQRAWLTDLFANGERVASDSPDRSLAIGVIDNFVPPADPTFASPTQKMELQEDMEAPTLRGEVAPRPQPVGNFGKSQIEASAAEQAAEKGDALTSAAEAATENTELIAALKRCATPNPNFPAACRADAETAGLIAALKRRSTQTLDFFRDLVAPPLPRVAWSRIATAAVALSVCALALVTWHRIQRIPGSQAHDQPRLRDKVTSPPDSSPSRAPSVLAQNPPASVPVETAIRQHSVPKRAVHAASIITVIPVAKQRPRMQSAETTPNIQPSGQDSSVQVSRPPIHVVYPVHPDMPVRGVVALTARVDSGGAVQSVRVVSGKRALAAAAVHAVHQWRYSPYLKDGEPVATEANIAVSFFSEDAISLYFTPELPPTFAQNRRASAPAEATPRQDDVPKPAVDPPSVTTVVPAANRQSRIQGAESTPDIRLFSQDSPIQASRPPMHFVYPAYPDTPILGVVALTASVDSGGAVQSVRVVSGKPELAAAAVNAVRQWRYSPYPKDGDPIATETNIAISFFSEDAMAINFLPGLPPPDAELAKHDHSEKVK